MKLSVRAHLILLAVMALASYSIFLGAFFFYRLVDAEDLSKKESARAALAVAQRVGTLHERSFLALAKMGSAPETLDFIDRGGCESWARAAVSGLGTAKNLVVAKRNGEIACSGHPPTFLGAGRLAEGMLLEALEGASKGKSRISGVWGEGAQREYALVAPVERAGAVLGFLLLIKETGDISEIVRSAQTPAGLSLAVLGRDGQTLADRGWWRRSQRNAASEAGKSALAKAAALPESARAPSGDFLAFAALPASGWVVASDLPKQSIYQEEQEAVALQSALALLFGGMLFGLFFQVSSRLSAAALTLTRVAERDGRKGEKILSTGVLEIDNSLARIEQSRKMREKADRERALWKEAALGGASGLAIGRWGKAGPEIEFCNEAFLHLVGLGGHAGGERIALGSLPNSSCLAESGMSAALERAMRDAESMERQAGGVDAEGRKIRVSVSVEPIWPGSESGGPRVAGEPAPYYSVYIDDLTQILEREEAMAKQASTDSLTGLPNRALFSDRLEQALHLAKAKKGRVAVACVNINRFKLINDTLGHAYGDELLIHVAKRVSFQLRPGETLSRLGSDEFGLILGLGEDARDSVSDRLEALVKNFKDPFFAKGKEITVTVSIGVAAYPEDSDSAADLLQKADIAMIQAKGETGGAVRFFSGDMGAAFRERHQMEQALQAAIKRGDIQVMLQPKASLENGKPTGAEALARWTDPELGAVPPWKFIPLAEDAGLMGELGRLVLEKSLAAAKSLIDDGFDCPVAVNISAKQIEPGFAAGLRRMIEAAGVPPSAVHVEITESSILPNSETMMDFLGGLKEMGIKVAMDDFGTGWSNLSLLKKLPLSYLKMDRSFVVGIGQAREDDALAKSIVGMAKALGIKVIAEGVETLDQAQRLRDMGADDLQGYLAGKPQPLKDLKEWLRAGAPLSEKG